MANESMQPGTPGPKQGSPVSAGLEEIIVMANRIRGTLEPVLKTDGMPTEEKPVDIAPILSDLSMIYSILCDINNRLVI